MLDSPAICQSLTMKICRRTVRRLFFFFCHHRHGHLDRRLICHGHSVILQNVSRWPARKPKLSAKAHSCQLESVTRGSFGGRLQDNWKLLACFGEMSWRTLTPWPHKSPTTTPNHAPRRCSVPPGTILSSCGMHERQQQRHHEKKKKQAPPGAGGR
jgi:hypothetical protein